MPRMSIATSTRVRAVKQSKGRSRNRGANNSCRPGAADLERLNEFLLETEPDAASETVSLVTTAIETLENHPLIGRAYSPDVRELVISRGHTGHVALYRFTPAHDLVAILSIRHQRESGYSTDEPAG